VRRCAVPGFGATAIGFAVAPDQTASSLSEKSTRNRSYGWDNYWSESNTPKVWLSQTQQRCISGARSETSINASVPPGPGIDEESHANRLQGSETACRNCGHELELYYY